MTKMQSASLSHVSLKLLRILSIIFITLLKKTKVLLLILLILLLSLLLLLQITDYTCNELLIHDFGTLFEYCRAQQIIFMCVPSINFHYYYH